MEVVLGFASNTFVIGVLDTGIGPATTLLFRCKVAFLLIGLLIPVIGLTGAVIVNSAVIYANVASQSL
jgi:hypothetical protein